MIMPGSIPLSDSTVRHKSIHYLPQGWEPVIEREVDGERSEPYRIDGDDTRFGSVQAAKRTMRSIFLGSAPSSRNQVIKGIQLERIILGSAQPGQNIGVFDDVLKRLRDRLHYLYSDQDRFWLDTKPNLRREMESRKQNIDELVINSELKSHITAMFAKKGFFAGVHVFTSSSDVPDEWGVGPRLVVLPPHESYTKRDDSDAIAAAENILSYRGDQPRQKRNRLIFFAADKDVVGRLKDAARTYLAWRAIVSDINEGKLNLDLFQVKLAENSANEAQVSLKQMAREAYKWVLCPEQPKATDKNIEWETVSVSTNSSNLVQEIENRLHEEEWIITEWSPIHLKKLLEQLYFKKGTPDAKSDISALQVYRDICQYLYLPRLLNEQVYKDAIVNGLENEDFFGFASGKDGDQYLGFCFGNGGLPYVDDTALLIEKDTALIYREKIKPAPELETTNQPDDNIGGYTNTDIDLVPTATPQSTLPVSAGALSEPTAIKKQFYGSIDLDPVKAKMDFATIVDEVVQQFTAKLGIEVTISVEIQAKSQDGFDESLQRTIKENCNVLGFKNSEFEEE